MLGNYFKITLRNIARNKSIPVINIGGLAVGMACVILILLFVQDELSFDKFNINNNRIYRVVLERSNRNKIDFNVTTPPALAPALKNDFQQDIKNIVRFLKIDNPSPVVNYNDNRFYEKQFFFTDPDVFNVFTIPFIYGDSKTALQKPNTIVLTESSAKKYFGDRNPVGKTLLFNNLLTLEVTGVVKSLPSNSSIRFDFLTSFSTLNGWLGKEFVENWNNNMCQTYILLPKNSSRENLALKFPQFINKYSDENSSLKNIFLQPLDRIHLYSTRDYGLAGGGDIQYVYLLILAALFVLLIACFNFISLTTARSANRSKEVGIKKVLGATRKQLIQQFFFESMFLLIISLIISVFLVEIALPYFNQISDKNLSVFNLQNLHLLLLPCFIVFAVGVIANAYPSFVLSSLMPVQSIKGNLRNVYGKAGFRKVLVVFQFTLTIILIVGTIVVYNQLEFIKNKKLGFDKDQLLIIPVRDENLRQNPELLKERLQRYPGILNVSAASLLPGGPVGKINYKLQGNPEEGTMSVLWVDPDFIRTLDIKLIAGRDFSKDIITDASESFILNKEAVKQLGWSNPSDAIGKTFELSNGKKGVIIGVVKDFNFTSLREKIGPVVLQQWSWLNYILVKVEPSHLTDILKYCKETWHEFEPDNPFSYSFLDDSFNNYYKSEIRFGYLSGFFTFLAILIACLGLFSMAAFTAEKRTKEFGIRKVVGASSYSILVLQIQQFIGLVLIANIIALPVSYYVMNLWLQNFAYRIEVSAAILLQAGLIVVVITLLTVSYQAIKTAIANPVESLRYE